jgi:hypothetical protein
MKRAILFSTIAVCMFSLTVNPPSWSAETKVPRSSDHHRAIVMEVLIVGAKGGTKDEHALELCGPSDEVAVRIRQLESAGQIVVIDRIRLTTVENQKTVFQAGATTPVASGRNFGGRGGGAQTSYQHQQLGTLISATAKVDGDVIVVELEVEKSQLERRTGQPQPDDEFVPLATETLTSHVTLPIGNGKTVLACSLENRAEAGSSAQLVLASARLLEPSSDAEGRATADGADRRQIRIFALQRTSAKDAAIVLKELFDDGLDQIAVSVDSRTNSLIVRAEQEHHLDAMEAILLRLDESDPWRVSPTPKDKKEADATPVSKTPIVTKYDKMAKKDLQEELKRLQEEVLDAERTAKQFAKKAADAARAYTSATDEEKADALLRMIEAEAAGRKPTERFRQIRADFDAAKRAYLQLLVTE